jgi:hypothetical protein
MLAATLLMASFAAEAAAKNTGDARTTLPESYTQMLRCRSVTDAAERLACYDAGVAKLQQAQESADIVIVEKREVQEAKRGLFGFSLPQVKLFGGGAGDDDVNELTATVARAQRYDYSRWRLVLDNGSTWDQIEPEPLAIDPEAGTAIVIKRASFGSYKARIGGQPPVRVRRVQ